MTQESHRGYSLELYSLNSSEKWDLPQSAGRTQRKFFTTGETNLQTLARSSRSAVQRFAFPQPPPPGDSMRTLSPERRRTLIFPEISSAEPSRRMTSVRPGEPSAPPARP